MIKANLQSQNINPNFSLTEIESKIEIDSE